MSDPYLGEIRIVSFNFAPQGWALCNGQMLSIQQNTALFSILGTTYGGNGVQTFALPNFQGRIPMSSGTSTSGYIYVLGENDGEEQHTLLINELPQHNHLISGSSANSTSGNPTGNVWGASPSSPFSTGATNTTLASASVVAAGNSIGHENRNPFLVLNFIIAMQGIFPSRS